MNVLLKCSSHPDTQLRIKDEADQSFDVNQGRNHSFVFVQICLKTTCGSSIGSSPDNVQPRWQSQRVSKHVSQSLQKEQQTKVVLKKITMPRQSGR